MTPATVDIATFTTIQDFLYREARKEMGNLTLPPDEELMIRRKYGVIEPRPDADDGNLLIAERQKRSRYVRPS